MITYAQLLIAFYSEGPNATETVTRWVRRSEDRPVARFGDWFDLGTKDQPGMPRLVTLVSTDLVADTQWVALDAVRHESILDGSMSSFLLGLSNAGWLEVERIPVDRSVSAL